MTYRLKKNIISVANVLEESRLGGPQMRIALVAKYLHRNVETTVVMPVDNSMAFCELCRESGVQYKTFRLSRITKEWKVAFRYLVCFLYEVSSLCLYFKKEDFDIVHVSGGSWQYKGVIAAKIAKKKVIWHLNDTSMPKLFREIFRMLGFLVDGYIYASNRSMDYYSVPAKKNKQNFLIPAPVDTQKFDPKKKYDKKLIEKNNKKIIVGTVANVNPIKDFDTFIRCAAELNKENDDILFVVVGAIYTSQKKYFQQLQRLCEKLSVNNMSFIGACADVRPILHDFDVYVCSSQAESSPLAVWEAMSMEKPVVSTDVGDVSIYVKDGYNGFIVPVGNSKDMAEKITILIKDKKTRDNFGQKSRQIAIHELDVRICAKRHLDAYKSILNMKNE